MVPVGRSGINGCSIRPLWLADGTRIYLRNEQRASILNVMTGQTVLTFPLKSARDFGPVIPQLSGQDVASLEQGNLLEIWDTVTGAKIATTHLSMQPVTGSWLADGKHIEIGNKDRVEQLYDAANGKLLITYLGDEASLSPDGKYIATENNIPDQQHGGILKSIVQVLDNHQ
jgi:WD40 repeat protein